MPIPLTLTLTGLAYVLFGIFAEKIHLITSPAGWSFYGSVLGAFVFYILTLEEE